ncbi:metallophosphoesterase family protein [Deinococcus cellulosilyticus]|uniref:Calcineurin-like phosphoesterase domain-containing protein n=1 Tax=Deinococcus cellulosilyticus (strain DSM 18568 / NBRC 106333 / KACC 11606 / 5516J-15) TaxID=1223518 RepID=A0A511NCH3_DEIC1|nr:metallophosphoesterase [Deinococcus cellulosilyticus]GEM50041.1 hypothetical protein DC3_56760 [Deinococcus cellulosilyticus NBRC 106333 = KACC 11606]
MNPIRVIHLSDLHLGFQGPSNLTVPDGPHAGVPLRQHDLENAVEWLCSNLVQQPVPVNVVLIAGDVFDRSNPLPRAVHAAGRLIHILTQQEIEVVVVDGNHDTPSALSAGHPMAYLALFGAHIVHGEKVQVIHTDHWKSPHLQHLAVHCIPRRALKNLDVGEIHPFPDRCNVLLTHGLVASREDEPGEDGRIPRSLLEQSWDYIALGDWHGHMHQPVAGIPAYYPGSLERLHFGEAMRHPAQETDPYQVRGGLDVTLLPENETQVQSFPYPHARPMYHAQVEASEMTAEDLHARLDVLTQDLPAQGLLQVHVMGATQTLKAELNARNLNPIRQRIHRVELKWHLLHDTVEQSEQAAQAETLPEQWQAYLQRHAPDQSWLLQAGLEVLTEARTRLAQSAEEHP